MFNWEVLIKRKKIIQVLLLFVYFLILTIIFTRPLIRHMTDGTVSGFSDNLYFTWIIGWTRTAIFDLHQFPHKSHLLNHPYGYNLAFTEISPLQILIALPFALVTDNPILGFNVTMLSTFILAGFTMYYWVYKTTRNVGASLVASTAFAFLPYHVAHFLKGHLNLSAIQWFPLFFMGFIEILKGEKFSWKNIGFFTAGLIGITLTSQYYLFMTLFVCFIVLLVLLIKRNYLKNVDTWKQLILGGLFSIPALLVGILPYYLTHRGSNSIRNLSDVIAYSASITDYLLPFTKSMLAGSWVSQSFPRELWSEATLYLGIPIIFLAIVGYFVNRKTKLDFTVRVMGLIALIALVLSMGTNLTWMEQPVVIQTPSWMRSFISEESTYIFLPGYWLFRYFPFYNIMRVWMRYGVIVAAMICGLAGFGVHELHKKIRQPLRLLITIGIIGLVLVDFINTPFGITEIKPREVDRWLIQQSYGGQVQLPFNQSYKQSAIYFTLHNQKPLIGQMSTFPTHRYFNLEPTLRNFPDENSIKALEKEQIRYVIVDENYYDVTKSFIDECEKLGLDYGGSFDGMSVFLLY